MENSGRKGDVSWYLSPSDALEPPFRAVELDDSYAAWYAPSNVVTGHFWDDWVLGESHQNNIREVKHDNYGE